MNPVLRFGLLLFTIFTVAGCTNVKTAFVSSEDITLRSTGQNRLPGQSSVCHDYLNYYRDTLSLQEWPVFRIRVNVHFMNSEDSTQNLPEDKARDYANRFLYHANNSLSKNPKMFLPPGNNTPAWPKPWRYALYPQPQITDDDGIYFHYDDALYYYVKKGKNRNNSSRDVVHKYAIGEDSILNIFVMPHHPDSVASPTYRADGSGIALGKTLKIAGKWKDWPEPSSIRGLINHEIGHILGLSHTWRGNDGCDDTPNHPNCWNKMPEPPCDSLYSNNMMDYNTWQAALTPCQIGKVLRNLSRIGYRQRDILMKDWCERDSMYDVHVRDSIYWGGETDVYGSIFIHEGASLEMACRVSMPAGSSIVIMPGAKLILNNNLLHNACDMFWEGIKVQTKGKRKGEVVVIDNPVIENIRHPLHLEPAE